MALTLGSSLGGCYRYAPITGTEAGSEVRLRLTDAGAVTLAPLIGVRIETVDGRVTSVGDTSLVLSVAMTTDRLGNEVSWRGESVTFPRALVASVQSREFDRKRTFVIGGIATAAAVAIAAAFGLNGFGGGTGSGGTGGSTK